MINEEKLKELLYTIIIDLYNKSPDYFKIMENNLKEVFEE
jgi:hypothetical protein